MKEILQWLAIGAICFIALFVVIMAIRYFSNATTSITETKMKDGATCYLATTSDGVALSRVK